MTGQPSIDVKYLSRSVVFPAELAEDSWWPLLLPWLTTELAAEHGPQFTGVLEYLKDQQ